MSHCVEAACVTGRSIFCAGDVSCAAEVGFCAFLEAACVRADLFVGR